MSIPHLRDALIIYGLIALLWIAAFVGGLWLVGRVL